MSEDHREADEEQLGQQVTRSDYLWRTEWEWMPLGGRGRKGGAARSRAADYSDLSNNVGDEKLRTSLDGLAFPSFLNRETQVQERAWERLAPASKLDARIFNNKRSSRSYKSSRDCLDWLSLCSREHLESLERSPQMNESKTVAGLPGS